MSISNKVPFAIIGAAGKMGRAVCTAAFESPQIPYILTGAYVSIDNFLSGQKVANNLDIQNCECDVTYSNDLRQVIKDAQVVIDFSSPNLTPALILECVLAQKPLLIGTTGYDDLVYEEVLKASQHIPILLAPNTSFGVAVFTQIVMQTAQLLGPDYKILINETHHEHKKDAPSGTAKHFKKAIETVMVPADQSNIEIFSHRIGNIIGNHDVVFNNGLEEITLSHKALDRSVFARGALKAAAWLANQKPGLYKMADIL